MSKEKRAHSTNPNAARTLDELIGALKSGIEEIISSLPSDSALPRSARNELEDIAGFLETMRLIQDTLSEERMVESLRKSARSVKDQFTRSPDALAALPSQLVDEETHTPAVYASVIREIGPDVRISKNHMKAWIRIDSQDAAVMRFEDIEARLQLKGVVNGVDRKKIKDAIDHKLYDEDILIANGKNPTRGINGRVEFIVKIEDMGYTPKELENGSVSYKDIKLFAYVQEGDEIAKLIPASQGEPGATVLNEPIQPASVKEAELPDISYTRTINNKTRMVATENCCVTKKDGRIILEPALRVSGKVSNETGNIDSRVSVIINEDVLTGFSVRSDQAICVFGVVEGASIESKADLALKGGVHGKDKAQLNADGTINAYSLSHAQVNAMGDIIVDSQILNCVVHAAGRISVNRNPGDIIGGEINGNGDLLANSIGSDMGVKTIIRMGGRKNQLKALLNEARERISEQEGIIDQCNHVLFSLDEQFAQETISKEEYESVKTRASAMRDEASGIMKAAIEEADGLHVQIDSLPTQHDTVRARTAIFPGVIIAIDDVEMKVAKQLGPSTVVREGHELQIYPFKHIP